MFNQKICILALSTPVFAHAGPSTWTGYSLLSSITSSPADPLYLVKYSPRNGEMEEIEEKEEEEVKEERGERLESRLIFKVFSVSTCREWRCHC